MTFDAAQVPSHRIGSTRAVTLGDRLDDAFVFGEAVVVGGRAHRRVAQPPPGHGAANGVQRVEQSEQQRVLRSLADRAVQLVVPLLVLPPGRRLLRLDACNCAFRRSGWRSR